MRSTHAALALAGLLSVLAPAAVSRATIIEAMSLDELATHADAIALVTCVDARASRDDYGRIVTDYDLTVEETIKGDVGPGGRLTMRRLGGEIGDLGMRIEGEPHLVQGQRYLVFLRSTDRAVMRPVGMSQGVMPVEETAGVLTVRPGGGGLALVQRGAEGELHPAPAALLHAEPFERLRERIEAIRPGTIRPETVAPTPGTTGTTGPGTVRP